MNTETQYKGCGEESGFLGEIVAGIFKKGEQQSQKQLEATKNVVSLIEAKQRAASEKYALEQANRMKVIKIVAIVFGILIISVAIIIAIIQVKKAKVKQPS